MTTFEERVVDGIRDQIDKVPNFRPGQAPEPPSRWPRVVVAAAVVVVLAGGGLWLSEPRSSGPVASETGFVLQLPNGLELPVEEAPLMTTGGKTVYRGAESTDSLGFDPPGEEQALVVDRVPDEPPGPARGQAMDSLVYLGENRSHPIFLWVQPSFSVVGPVDDWLASMLDDTLTCVSIPGGTGCTGPAEEGDYVDIQSNIPSEGAREDFISWVSVPEQTAVVVVELGGRSYWQRPVASSVWFAYTDQEPAAGTMTAYTSNGEVIAQRAVATR